jgi:hypothetical protein
MLSATAMAFTMSGDDTLGFDTDSRTKHRLTLLSEVQQRALS